MSAFDSALRTLESAPFELDKLGTLELERGYAALTFLAARYLVSHAAPTVTVPLALSVPLLALSGRLRRKPTLTYSSYILSNWRGTGTPRSVSPTSVEPALTFSGTKTERQFIAVHIAIESLAPQAIDAEEALEGAIGARHFGDAIAPLREFQTILKTATSLLAQIVQGFDTAVFHSEVRPYLFGFSNVCFAGFEGQPHNYLGASGAQSGLLRYIDALVKPETRRPQMQNGIDKLVDYAPREHQVAIGRAASLGADLPALCMEAPEASEALKGARRALQDFRKAHLKIVGEVIQTSDGPTGTGGTLFNPWLSELITELDH